MGLGTIIGWAIFGLVAGAFARMLHPGRDPMNWVWTMFLGVGGALMGGWLGSQMGFNTDRGLSSWVAAIGGAILLLVIYHFLTSRTATVSGPAASDDYRRTIFKDLSRGPDG